MAIPDRLAGSLQENLLALLAHSDEHGRAVADMVDPALFEGDYRVVAERAVDYWRRYDRAPGPHMPDLLSDILEDKGDRRAPTFRSILLEMLRLSEGINAKFAVDQLRSFVRLQKFQQAVLETARRLQSQHEMALPEVEAMWSDLLKTREATFDRGMSLNDVDRILSYMQSTSGEFVTGIAELDRAGIVPVRAEVMLLLASTGVGKTWALIHIARHALMMRKRVLYVSLELGEELVAVRFWQSFFAVPKRAARDRDGHPLAIYSAVLEKDATGRLSNIDREAVEPEFTLDAPQVADEMRTRRALMEGKFRNLEIKRFPTRGLTVRQLDGYLDGLAQAGFEPDLLVLDYVGIMKTDAKDHRISLGRTFEDFRGLCVERNIAGVTAQQASKEGGKSRRTTQFNVAEDWSLVGTADACVSISATQAERRFGFARLSVEKGRNERDSFGVLVTQNYEIGQFAMDSAPLDSRYGDLFREHDDDPDADVTGDD